VAFLAYLPVFGALIQKKSTSSHGPTPKEIADMITTLVQIKLSEPLSLDKAQEVFADTAPKYLKPQGLIRKYYLLSEDGETAGGIYLWESRKAAEELHTDEWEEFIVQKYGTKPSVTYFNSPVIVDNLLGEIIKDVNK
jgi:hypothetical protein